MLKTLVSITKRGFWLVLLAWLLVIYTINVHFGSRYTQDSYTFYLLGKSIITGHGFYSPAIRDLYLDPAGSLVSRSYPPLFPLLVGITDFFLNQRVAAGPVINLFICMLSVYLWFNISKKISPFLFFITFLIPIAYSLAPPMILWIDATAGRSLVLAWLLALGTIHLLLKSSLLTDNKVTLGIGFLLGLLTLARFDSIMFCFALPAVLFCIIRLPVKKTLLMYAALLLTMLPWAIRNFIVFGSFLASDNSITAASTLSGIIQLSFFEHGVPLGSDNPKVWITQRIGYLSYDAWFFYSILTSVNQWLPVSVPITIIIRIIACLFLPGLIFSFITRKENYPLWLYFVFSVTWCLFNILCMSLTSYGQDPRYYGVSSFLVIGGGSFFIVSFIKKIVGLKFKKGDLFNPTRVGMRTILTELFLCIVAVFITVHIYSKELYYNKNDYFWTWTKQIEQAPVKPGELVATKEADLTSFYTGWNTIYIPENAHVFNNDYQAWLKYWKPSYLVVNVYDFFNPLAAYPHATVSTILDTVILLKLNLDETSLTEQDAENNTKMRNLWKQHIFSKLPSHDEFFVDTYSYKHGIALHWDGFTVPNTPDNQQKFAAGRVVLLPNGEQRLIKETFADRYYWNVKVMGGAISKEFTILPDLFETIDGDPPKPFFVTNSAWTRGVANAWAGFYIENTPKHQEQYKVGAAVQLPTQEVRTITKVESEASLLIVHLSGAPIDGFKVGTPEHFTVSDK